MFIRCKELILFEIFIISDDQVVSLSSLRGTIANTATERKEALNDRDKSIRAGEKGTKINEEVALLNMLK